MPLGPLLRTFSRCHPLPIRYAMSLVPKTMLPAACGSDLKNNICLHRVSLVRLFLACRHPVISYFVIESSLLPMQLDCAVVRLVVAPAFASQLIHR